MRILTVLIFVLTFFYDGLAQCQISGNIIDLNNERIPYATITLETSQTSKLKVCTSDDKGYFCVSDVAPNHYKLSISSVGYETYSIWFEVSSKAKNQVLSNIQLKTDSKSLSEITVTAESRVNEIKPSSIRYKTSSLVSQNGGSAGDILKNMPSVSMGGSPGHNRDIRFRGLGNAYTKVLINGRETALSGNNRETVLDQIPASSISYIEIIPVPGAEYNAEGINGIVNIVLKENAEYGLHGRVEGFAGNNHTQGGGMALSAKYNKFNWFGNYDFLQRSLPKTKDKVKSDLKDGAITQIEKSTELENKSFLNKTLRTGMDYYLLPKSKLTAEYLYGYQLEDKSKVLDATKTTPAGIFKSASQELKTEYKPNEYHQLMASAEHYFSNNARLLATYSYQTEEMTNENKKTVYAINKLGKWANFKPAMENNFELQQGKRMQWNVGISKFKLGTLNTLLAGYAGERESRLFNKTTDKFNYTDTSWVSSNNGFENFKVTETTHALYLSDEFKYSFLRAKAGLRYENTRVHSNSSTDTLTGNRTYRLLLPSVQITANIDETQSVSFNMGRRIRRPGFKDLNPFTEVKDDSNLKKGNPNLKPELAWAYELGYLKKLSWINMGANLFYRDITDVIQTLKTSDESNIITEQPINSGNARVMGLELTTTITPLKWWQITGNYSQFDSKITSGNYSGDALTDQYKWSAKLLSDFSFKNDLVIQLVGNIVGPKISSTKTEDTMWFVDLGIEKKILQQGRIYFRVTDLFNSIEKFKTETTTTTITDEHEYAEGRMFNIGIAWNF